MFNVLVIGDVAVGKTSLVRCFTGSGFRHLYAPTVGNAYVDFPVVVQGTPYTARIIDSPGSQQFRDFVHMQLRFADGIILVYSVDNPGVFSHCRVGSKRLRPPPPCPRSRSRSLGTK
jgi:small GTP-binding protein